MWKLWESTQDNDDHRVLSSITARVMAALRDIGTCNRLKDGTNPIRRGSIGVSGIDAKLYVYKTSGNGGSGGDNDRSANRRDQRIQYGKQAAEIFTVK